MNQVLSAKLLLAASDGGILNRVTPDAGPAGPVVDKGVIIVNAILALCILACVAAIIVGLSAKRGGVMAGNDLAARHGQGLLVGGTVGLLALLGIGTLLNIAMQLAP